MLQWGQGVSFSVKLKMPVSSELDQFAHVCPTAISSFHLVSSFRFGPDWEECLQAVSDEGQTARDMVAPAKIVSNADHCGLDYIVIHMICLYIFIGRLCPNSINAHSPGDSQAIGSWDPLGFLGIPWDPLGSLGQE